MASVAATMLAMAGMRNIPFVAGDRDNRKRRTPTKKTATYFNGSTKRTKGKRERSLKRRSNRQKAKRRA